LILDCMGFAQHRLAGFTIRRSLDRPWQNLSRRLAATVLSGSLLGLTMVTPPLRAQTSASCQIDPQEVTEKETLRKAAFGGDAEAREDYQNLLNRHATLVRECRSRTWPQTQAIWLRVYPCDANPGMLEQVLDRIANRGYNEVYIEVFYDSQVLLPKSDNPTPWESVVRTPGSENVDLLAQAIAKGRERGLKVYAWLFTLNFGYTYGQRGDRQQVLARNGYGQTTLTAVDDSSSEFDRSEQSYSEQAFIDPYDAQARHDYSWLVYSVLKRQPDGVLFDYVRYPRRSGADSVVSQVQDLWIYGDAAKQALYQRANNEKGRALIERFLSQGYVTPNDLETVNRLYPQEREPMWQGRDVSKPVQQQLWYLSVAHAVQGILDFLAVAAEPVQRQGLPSGAVFFPYGNQAVGEGGFDSRLQPWDRFPSSMQWHPMVYGVCGDTSCITDQVQRVLSYAPQGTQVIPALAGNWGESSGNRPSLEAQMEAIRRVAPQVNSISHFAYSWQEPEVDRQRKFCSLN
jgi:Glycosyl hydrolase-like 10